MTLLGLGQVVLAHPELRDRYLPAMRIAAHHLADPRQLAYATHRFGHSGLTGIRAGEGQAWLGYVALGLGMLRRLDPDMPEAALHDRIVAELARELSASDTGLIQTYPGEVWPPDIAAVAGAIGLHATATGRPRDLGPWSRRFARCAVDPATGMLRQRLSGCGRGVPRGSGTAVGAYFLSFATPDLARALAGALVRPDRLGFGAVREYPDGVEGGGDGDSGPVIFGVSVGATGFGLGAARIAGDRDAFLASWRTTQLFGVPTPDGFASGGVLGDALLLAMLTAQAPR
jgi:hypothetical protein